MLVIVPQGKEHTARHAARNFGSSRTYQRRISRSLVVAYKAKNKKPASAGFLQISTDWLYFFAGLAAISSSWVARMMLPSSAASLAFAP